MVVRRRTTVWRAPPCECATLVGGHAGGGFGQQITLRQTLALLGFDQARLGGNKTRFVERLSRQCGECLVTGPTKVTAQRAHLTPLVADLVADLLSAFGR